jgi:hypothetical protein
MTNRRLLYELNVIVFNNFINHLVGRGRNIFLAAPPITAGVAGAGAAAVASAIFLLLGFANLVAKATYSVYSLGRIDRDLPKRANYLQKCVRRYVLASERICAGR